MVLGFFNCQKWLGILLVALVVACMPLKAFYDNIQEKISPLVRNGIEAQQNEQYQKAYEIFKQAHEGGDVLGTALLGSLYANGLGVRANPTKAKIYFNIVLKNDDLQKEVSRNRAQDHFKTDIFVPTYRSAAMIVANLGLAHLYEVGLGVEKSPKKAFKLYKLILINMGANKGRNSGLAFLVNTATLGLGGGLTQIALGNAFKLEKLPVAVLAKLPFIKTLVAQTLYKMGMAYKMGVGVWRNRKKAKECFKMALDLGSDPALEAMRDLQ
ncbi:tetratricopeptide repeat protein [Helicobacter ailurogastricus]|uniref:beta-lactamase n=1 Tax=Helicobacter ailurogastricus TaxID=1578720 RepID=A0A0K2X2E8_9HELI|nr:SEL1-like repeat protein [Helicobacter ailurogastricus]CRF40360.1 hypothetical protein HAL011_01140 [Helicobacter ailurogastricus]CRF43009.1 hypothetical protein HAL013_12300 [Helicobacter ailurogastricus]CRF44717.1 hypothetical protein HAL09_13250 [Helicobacter ailurogastricus]